MSEKRCYYTPINSELVGGLNPHPEPVGGWTPDRNDPPTRGHWTDDRKQEPRFIAGNVFPHLELRENI